MNGHLPRVFLSLAAAQMLSCQMLLSFPEDGRDASTSVDGASAPDSGTAGDAGPPPATEDCHDGLDNDGNGSADCVEPSCAPYVRCIADPAAYAGWTGYVSLVSGDAPCPSGMTVTDDVWLADDGLATCPACTCTSHLACPSATVGQWAVNAGCNAAGNSFEALSTCTPIPPMTASQVGGFWRYQIGYTTAGCAPGSAGQPALPPKSQVGRVCTHAALGVGCPAGQFCVERAATGLCIARPAGPTPAACPPSLPVMRFSAPKLADPSVAFSDERSCSPCTCAAPTGGGCTGALELFSDANCSTSKGTVPPSVCTSLGCQGLCRSARFTGTVTPWTCAPRGGRPTGSVRLTGNGTQYCCDR